jgi:hypothetical protein
MTHTYTLFKPTSYAYTLLGARWRLGEVPDVAAAARLLQEGG